MIDTTARIKELDQAIVYVRDARDTLRHYVPVDMLLGIDKIILIARAMRRDLEHMQSAFTESASATCAIRDIPF